MPNLQGGPVEVAGAAYQQEMAAVHDASMWRLRARRWRLSRRDDDESRARLRAVRRELAWREHR
jgi:hypothetical protein